MQQEVTASRGLLGCCLLYEFLSVIKHNNVVRGAKLARQQQRICRELHARVSRFATCQEICCRSVRPFAVHEQSTKYWMMDLTCTVTCMDARIDPAAAFGINLGDAHVIRNAGGNARDALRSLIISQQLLGTQEVLLLKHTGCGMLTFENEDAHGVVKKNLGEAAEREIGGLDFQPFGDLEQAVKDDVAWLKSSKTIPDSVKLSGWVYEVETGKVRNVVSDS